MSINLVDLIMKQVGGQLPGVLGSLLGESASRTEGAIAGAVPAILGSLMGVASKGGSGAEQLVSAVRNQDDSMLDNLAGMLGSGNHQAIADQGSSMLSSLLGDGVIGSLVGAIGNFSGLGGGSSKSLLGMLAPIVMSVLSKQQASGGLDAGGLLNMLAGQKEHIQKAMPSGLASELSGLGLMDGVMGAAQSATEAVGDAVESATGAAQQAASATAAAAGRTADSVSNVAAHAGAAASDAASTGGSWLRWALPLIVLVVLVWLAFQFLGGSNVEEAASDASDAVSSAVEATTEAASDATDAASDAASAAVEATTEAASDAASTAGGVVTAMVGDVDVGGELTSMFDGMTQTLSGITDVETAEAALPSLEEMSTNLDSLTGLADQLPEDAVAGISEMVASSLTDLDAVMDSLKAIPGVGDLIEPVIATIKEKLAAFTTA